MSIRVRRGNKAEFDPNKLLSGELAAPLDSKELYAAFAPGDVKKIATYEDMQSNIASVNAEIIEDLTSGANAVANVVEGILDGYNTMLDETTSTPYVVKVNNGTIYLEEAIPDPTPPISETILTDIADLQSDKLDKTGDSKDNTVTFTEAASDVDIATGESHATLFGKLLKSIKTLRTGKFDKSNIVQTDTVNDANKIASSAVAYAHGLEIDTLNSKLSRFGRFAIQDANVTLGATQTIIPMTRVLENADNYYTVNADGSVTLPAGAYQITMNLHALIQSSDVIFFGVSSTGGFANLSLEPQSGAYQAYKEMSCTVKSASTTNLYVRGSSSGGSSYVLGYIAATDTVLTIQKLA